MTNNFHGGACCLIGHLLCVYDELTDFIHVCVVVALGWFYQTNSCSEVYIKSIVKV
jgi:hypothetical protein